jgi:hypothetical protein
MTTMLSLGKMNMSVADWLVWRREVLPGTKQFMASMANGIEQVRSEALRKGVMTVAAEAEARPGDIIIHIDEMDLKNEIDELEITAGDLDGKLSLLNATTKIEV